MPSHVNRAVELWQSNTRHQETFCRTHRCCQEWDVPHFWKTSPWTFPIFQSQLTRLAVFHQQHLRCGNGVGVFVSAQDTRLSLIATDQSYRQNFTAADDSRSTKMGTIHSIIDMIVRVSFGVGRKKVSFLPKWNNVSFLSFQTNETKDTVCVFRHL